LRELDHLVELDKNEDVSQTKREMRMALGLSAEGLKKLNLDYEIEKIINSL